MRKLQLKHVIYEEIGKEGLLKQRNIYVIMPADAENILAVTDLGNRKVEFIKYEKLSKYVSYEEALL